MKKGFTLIELLVVVLIIGILSAVALPQYRRTVERAKTAEAMVNIKLMKDNISAYMEANGQLPATKVEGKKMIDIGELSGGAWNDSNEYVTANWKYKYYCDRYGCRFDAVRKTSGQDNYKFTGTTGTGQWNSLGTCAVSGDDESKPDNALHLYICHYYEGQGWQFQSQ